MSKASLLELCHGEKKYKAFSISENNESLLLNCRAKNFRAMKWKTYRTRFQIEFCYRDSKQFTGLMDCQARHKRQLDFAFNASFASLNAAKVFMKDNGMDNSMAKVKLLMFNANYTKLIFDMSRCRPNRTLISKIVKELIGWQPKAA